MAAIFPASDIEITLPVLSALRTRAEEVAGTRWHTIDLVLETIMPVYGGGTTARQVDALAPFRARAIRNAIKHWWWEINRHRDEFKIPNDPATLEKTMAVIWGQAASAKESNSRSSVQLRVRTISTVSLKQLEKKNPVNHDNIYTLGNRKIDAVSYALWGVFAPPGPGQQHVPVKVIPPGAQFSVNVRVSKALSDEQVKGVARALNAWVHLGGIGARTRRGLGKVKVVSANYKEDSPLVVKRTVAPQSDEWFGADAFPGYAMRGECENPIDAWDSSVAIYREFRQARKTNPDDPNRRYKRSYWHKMDVIRALTGLNCNGRHLPHHTIKKGDNLPMEELVFGAPIIVTCMSPGDPEEATLRFATGSSEKDVLDRFPSPMLVTIVRTADNKYRPIAVQLHWQDDVRSKHVRVKSGTTNEFISPQVWWPDLRTDEGRVRAIKQLSSEGRHRQTSGPVDRLRELLVNSAKEACGDPLTTFLYFFKNGN